jgi:hypothetical protein
MKTLIFPDVHNKISLVNRIIEAEKQYDKAIFLGDYFDGRPDGGPKEAYRTAIWLKESLSNDKHLHLWGNHDVSYGFVNDACGCSGYTYEKFKAIRDVLTNDDFNKLKFFSIQEGWLCSHAGLHPHFLPSQWKTTDISLKNIEIWLEKESKTFYERILLGDTHWFITAGDSRRSRPLGINQGGLLWCDLREFEPVQQIAQVFGHTRQKWFPTVVRGELGEEKLSNNEVLLGEYCHKGDCNVALDCSLQFYAVIENGKLRIKPTPNTNETGS